MSNNESNNTVFIAIWTDTPLTITLYFSEIFLYLVTIICCSFFIFLLKNARVFHGNLSTLLGHMAFGCIVLGFTRGFAIIQSIDVYFAGQSAELNITSICWTVNTIYYCSLYIVGLSPITLVIERSLATIWVKSYEKQQSIFVGIILIVLQWVFCFLAVLLSELKKHFTGVISQSKRCEDQGNISVQIMLVSLYVLVAVDFVAIAAFIGLLYENRRRYSATFLELQVHSLSERYQLSENIKATRFFYPVVIVNFVIVITCIGMVLFILLVKETSYAIMITAEIFDHSFQMLIAVYAVVFPWLSIYGHPEMLRQARMYLGHSGSKVGPCPYEPKNANGTTLILDQGEERELHFAALNSMWNS